MGTNGDDPSENGKPEGVILPQGDRPKWELLKVAYVHGTMSGPELARMYGISPDSVACKINSGKWVAARAAQRRKEARIASRKIEKDSVQAHSQAIRLVNRAKVRVAKLLLKRLEDETYLPTPSDLALLQKLESTLRDPGWDKRAGDGQTVVNVGIHIEGLLSEIQAKRKEALGMADAPITVTAEKHLSDSVENFLADDGDDEEEQARNGEARNGEAGGEGGGSPGTPEAEPGDGAPDRPASGED